MATDISFKRINHLAIPALLAGIAEPLLSITDTALVGKMPENATESLAAIGIVGSFLSMLIWVLGQTRSVISTLVSQYIGANKFEAIKTLPMQAISLNLILSFLVILSTYWTSHYIFSWFNASGLVLEFAVDYYKIRVLGFPLTLFTFAVFGIFRGLQNTFYPMIVAITGALLNIVFDIVFIYGIDGVLEARGLEGAAYASVLAQMIMAIMALVLLIKKTKVPIYIHRVVHPEMKNLIIMVLHLFVRTLALNVALILASKYAAKYGDEYIAAQTIAYQIWLFFAFVVDGYSSAGNILGGKLKGGKEYLNLYELHKKLNKYAIGLGVLIPVVCGIFYYQIGWLFSNEIAVVSKFEAVFWFVLLMQPICSLAFIYDGFFKGLGEMAALRNVLVVATFAGFVPTLVLLDALDWKLFAVWSAFLVWMIIRCFMLRSMFINRYVKPHLIS